ncbi:MAG: carboxypeptidase-like regulatory domain-containing protein [bacterium]|nr:carboxypeptidase-like regulatory domain-containing protein [bacterium]
MKKIIFILTLALVGLFLAGPSYAAVYNYDLIGDGNFENGLNSWVCSCEGSDLKYNPVYAYKGDYYLSLGNYNGSEIIAKNVTLPDYVIKLDLSFYYNFNTEDNTGWQGEDYFNIQVQDVYTNEYYINDSFYPSDSETAGWTRQSYDLSSLKGKFVAVRFTINNDNNLLTYVDLDNIKLQAKSYSIIRGTVKNSNGDILPGATVKIKTVKGKILWSGTTNAKGKFRAKNLKGLNKKAKIIIKESGSRKVFRRKLKWGNFYSYKFRM